MRHISILSFLILPVFLSAQTINGKVYDQTTTVKGALVVNMSQNIMTYTNDEGDFSIEAQVQDTLYVSSLFHTKTLIEIEKRHFEDILIIEVKKAINELDEILLRDQRKKKFDSIQMETQVVSQIKEDMKQNPHLYTKASTNGNMNFIAIANLIASIFKSKKSKKEPVVMLTYTDLEVLFSKDRFFTEKLLTFDLNIPKEYQSLFFEFCDAKGINSKLLAKNKQVELLEILVTYSAEFQNHITKN